jgi:hypothetical protein
VILYGSGDKIFEKPVCANTDFIIEADNFFHNDYFFADIGGLYDDMGDNFGTKSGSSSTIPYVKILLVEIMLQCIVLAFHLELILS